MRIGIIGAGQLGQMLGHAARDLDVESSADDMGGHRGMGCRASIDVG